MEQPDPTPPDEEVLSAQIIERLLRYDELDDEELAVLEADPAARVELHRLQLAEAWLTEPFQEKDVEPTQECSCPSADDLFDYGQKIEPTGLNIARQVEVAEHLKVCPDCEALVSKLAERPPSPLIVVDSPLPDPVPTPAPRPRSSRAIRLARGPRPSHRSGLRHVPFLVAASLLAVLVVSGWPSSVLGKDPMSFPSPAVMRGNTSQRLVSPKDLVLARSRDLPGLPRLSDVVFEVRPEHGDARYDVYVYQGHSSALESADKRLVLYHITSSEPTLQLAGPLPTGRYSWEAWSVRDLDGTPRRLGEANFNVVLNPGLERAILHKGGNVAAVRELHENNFVADARALARELVQKGMCNLYEAERYLAVTPAD
jgi:hypothetical protein